MKGCIHHFTGLFITVAVILLIILIALSFYGRLMCDTFEGPANNVVTCIIMLPK